MNKNQKLLLRWLWLFVLLYLLWYIIWHLTWNQWWFSQYYSGKQKMIEQSSALIETLSWAIGKQEDIVDKTSESLKVAQDKMNEEMGKLQELYAQKVIVEATNQALSWDTASDMVDVGEYMPAVEVTTKEVPVAVTWEVAMDVVENPSQPSIDLCGESDKWWRNRCTYAKFWRLVNEGLGTWNAQILIDACKTKANNPEWCVTLISHLRVHESWRGSNTWWTKWYNPFGIMQWGRHKMYGSFNEALNDFIDKFNKYRYKNDCTTMVTRSLYTITQKWEWIANCYWSQDQLWLATSIVSQPNI